MKNKSFLIYNALILLWFAFPALEIIQAQERVNNEETASQTKLVLNQNIFYGRSYWWPGMGRNESVLPKNLSKFQNLRILELSGALDPDLQKDFTAVIPPEIFKLDRLEVLNLSGNALLEIPQELGNLKSLKRLDLSHNTILRLPASISNLIQLKELNLASNQQGLGLKEREANSWLNNIGTLQNLEKLNLADCQLEVLPGEIGRLKNLKELNLSENYIKSWPKELGLLTNLIKLNLYNSGFEPNAFSLKALNLLKELEISGDPPPEIWNLSNLRRLKIGMSRLAEIPTGLSRLINLEELDLLSYEVDDYLSQLRHLPEELKKLKKLRRLSFYGSHMDDLRVELKKTESIPIIVHLSSAELDKAKGLPGNVKLAITHLDDTSLPEEIFDFDNIEILHIESHDIDLPSKIDRLHNLKELHLLYPGGPYNLPPEVSNLKNLEYMSLVLEKSTLPFDLMKLSNLRKIRFYILSNIDVFPYLELSKLAKVGVHEVLLFMISPAEYDIDLIHSILPNTKVNLVIGTGADIDNLPKNKLVESNEYLKLIEYLIAQIPKPKDQFEEFLKLEREKGFRNENDRINFRKKFIFHLINNWDSNNKVNQE